MKRIILSLTLLLSALAHADELADANALFAKKAYPQALQSFTKLANGGNAEAQLHLGEMYLYGEAGAVDMAKAESWFKKSAAKGNKTAVAALAMMKQREERKADLDYWMTKYDGAELTSGKYRCPVPRIPSMSKQNEEINEVAAKVEVWQACYNAFVVNINEAAPLTKRIPKDIVDLLTKDEMATVTAHLDAVYSGIVESARVSSKLFLADFAAWRDATDAYVANHNQIINDAAEKKRIK
ncbi:MAG: tetratricopeptide repeat protein [Massilia sp.]